MSEYAKLGKSFHLYNSRPENRTNLCMDRYKMAEQPFAAVEKVSICLEENHKQSSTHTPCAPSLFFLQKYFQESIQLANQGNNLSNLLNHKQLCDKLLFQTICIDNKERKRPVYIVKNTQPCSDYLYASQIERQGPCNTLTPMQNENLYSTIQFLPSQTSTSSIEKMKITHSTKTKATAMIIANKDQQLNQKISGSINFSRFFDNADSQECSIIQQQIRYHRTKNSKSVSIKNRKQNQSPESSEYEYSLYTNKRITKKVNDTKNITKNFSKAIISYVVNNPEGLSEYFSTVQYQELVVLLKSKKNSMTNIKQLRDLWIDEGKYSNLNMIFRQISKFFLKNQSVAYIYNSRITNTIWHLKYRQNLLRALKEPENFNYIKDI